MRVITKVTISIGITLFLVTLLRAQSLQGFFKTQINPENAKVIIRKDGKTIKTLLDSQTPTALDLASYNLVIESPNFESRSLQIKLEKKDTLIISVNLKPIPKDSAGEIIPPIWFNSNNRKLKEIKWYGFGNNKHKIRIISRTRAIMKSQMQIAKQLSDSIHTVKERYHKELGDSVSLRRSPNLRQTYLLPPEYYHLDKEEIYLTQNGEYVSYIKGSISWSNTIKAIDKYLRMDSLFYDSFKQSNTAQHLYEQTKND